MAATFTVVAKAQCHVTAWPADQPKPNASVVNALPGEIRANTQIVAASSGRLLVEVTYGSGSVEVIVDLVGVLKPTTLPRDGRIVPLPSSRRLLDTREIASPLKPGDVATVRVPRDLDHVQAMIVNITPVNSAQRGHLTAYPSGTTKPNISNVNVDAAGQTRAAIAIVPVTGGAIDIFDLAGGHLVVDMMGYITSATAEPSTEGRFVPVVPTRLHDGRDFGGTASGGAAAPEIGLGRTDIAAAWVNYTMVRPIAHGHSTLHPAGTPKPTTSNLNYTPGSIVANGALVTASDRGITAWQMVGGFPVVDLMGYITGSPVAATLPAGSERYGIQGIHLEDVADQWWDIGTSTAGRPMRVFQVGTGSKTAVIATHVHGDEWSGESIVTDIATRGGIPGWTLLLLPACSPDARAANTRYVNGVDLNRDFHVGWAAKPYAQASGCVTTQTGSAPYSSREARLLRDAFSSGPLSQARVMLSHHDNYNYVARQKGMPQAAWDQAVAYARATGLRLPSDYDGITPNVAKSYTYVPGGFETFVHEHAKIPTFLVENKAGYGGACPANSFGVQPAAAHVTPHWEATRRLLANY